MATLQQIIVALPVGKSDTIKVPAFEQAVEKQPTGTNNDQTRRETKSAINENNIPIESKLQIGYWFINSDTEFQEVVNRLDSIIQAYMRKKYAILLQVISK